MPPAPSTEGFRVSDAAVVARYLQLRSLINDRILARIEQRAMERYQLMTTRRLTATLTAHVRCGFVRPDGGEIWPVVFLSAVDITPALCAQLTPDWLANLGTTINGPQRIRHRHWEEWWGWERRLGEIHSTFFELPPDQQEDALGAFYRDGFEWLAQHGLVMRK
jgi:hypothetical protein